MLRVTLPIVGNTKAFRDDGQERQSLLVTALDDAELCSPASITPQSDCQGELASLGCSERGIQTPSVSPERRACPRHALLSERLLHSPLAAARGRQSLPVATPRRHDQMSNLADRDSGLKSRESGVGIATGDRDSEVGIGGRDRDSGSGLGIGTRKSGSGVGTRDRRSDRRSESGVGGRARDSGVGSGLQSRTPSRRRAPSRRGVTAFRQSGPLDAQHFAGRHPVAAKGVDLAKTEVVVHRFSTCATAHQVPSRASRFHRLPGAVSAGQSPAPLVTTLGRSLAGVGFSLGVQWELHLDQQTGVKKTQNGMLLQISLY